jgi:hypothetical protein
MGGSRVSSPLAARSACLVVRAMLPLLDAAVGLLVALALFIVVFGGLIFLVPAALSTLLPHATTRLKARFAKVEAMYGEDQETYQLLIAFGVFAIGAGLSTLLIVLAFGGAGTGSGRFKISGAYQRVYGFFSALGANPFWGGVGTFVSGIAVAVSTVAGCVQLEVGSQGPSRRLGHRLTSPIPCLRSSTTSHKG